MPVSKNPPPSDIGFPSLSWEDEEPDTRPLPMPLHERPMQARDDVEMARIAERHIRVALAIENFWGHRGHPKVPFVRRSGWLTPPSPSNARRAAAARYSRWAVPDP